MGDPTCPTPRSPRGSAPTHPDTTAPVGACLHAKPPPKPVTEHLPQPPPAHKQEAQINPCPIKRKSHPSIRARAALSGASLSPRQKLAHKVEDSTPSTKKTPNGRFRPLSGSPTPHHRTKFEHYPTPSHIQHPGTMLQPATPGSPRSRITATPFPRQRPRQAPCRSGLGREAPAKARKPPGQGKHQTTTLAPLQPGPAKMP